MHSFLYAVAVVERIEQFDRIPVIDWNRRVAIIVHAWLAVEVAKFGPTDIGNATNAEVVIDILIERPSLGVVKALT
jgi:hypothetical protein